MNEIVSSTGYAPTLKYYSLGKCRRAEDSTKHNTLRTECAARLIDHINIMKRKTFFLVYNALWCLGDYATNNGHSGFGVWVRWGRKPPIVTGCNAAPFPKCTRTSLNHDCCCLVCFSSPPTWLHWWCLPIWVTKRPIKLLYFLSKLGELCFIIIDLAQRFFFCFCFFNLKEYNATCFRGFLITHFRGVINGNLKTNRG